MNKKTRQVVYDKFNGLCAYTGKPLDEKWQVDHMLPQYHVKVLGRVELTDQVNHIDNLMPSIRIVNHYKRGHNLESFRTYMKGFHLRLAKLPKTTRIEKTVKRIEYMNQIAGLFGITVDKPFNGKFYFEIN